MRVRVHSDELPREMSVVAKEDAELDALADSIVQVVKEARASTVRHINNTMCKFYLAYPICQNVSDKLNWSQICELITIADPLEREGAYEVGQRHPRRRGRITQQDNTEVPNRALSRYSYSHLRPLFRCPSSPQLRLSTPRENVVQYISQW